MSRSIDVAAFLDGVAGATNDTFRLVGSDMQKEAAEARAAVAELLEAAKEVTEAPALSADEIKAMARLINAVARAGGAQ